ncbi:MAG: hypothetical protein JWQ48_833 [Conexibacter sp.]|nr:hypothetical protein [Conexibacter sp.]
MLRARQRSAAASDPEGRGSSPPLPAGFEPRKLALRALQVIVLLTVVVLVALLAPGLGQVRDHIGDARPGWLVVAVALEALSCFSYVLLFRAVFCREMSWKTSMQIGWAELGVGSIVPASGAAGLALGAWALIQGGMAADRVARRSVAFFLIKGSVNFVAVAVVGVLMAIGVGPHRSLWLTAFPAALSVLVIAAVVALPKLGEGTAPGPEAGKVRRGIAAARGSIVQGTREAGQILRRGDPLAIAGALGYWVWDNAVLWATFHAFGASPPLTVILMAYLIGQLGGLLPIPGGIGGIDGGLIGTFIVFGAPAAITALAVLTYRIILFWLPLVGGAIAFVSLRRDLARDEQAVFAHC